MKQNTALVTSSLVNGKPRRIRRTNMTKPITKLITLQAITSLHPGTGQNTGVVDLPIQREVHTEFPMYASSGFKGSLRDKAEQTWDKNDDKVILTFGASTETNNDAPSAGAFAITDARILAFPVRSLQQVFVWITCPMIIQRLKRDAKLIGQKSPEIPDVEFEIPNETAFISSGSTLTSPLVLEEMAYQCVSKTEVNDIASLISSLLKKDSGFDENRLVVLSNEDFKYHVKYGTQVSARIKLNEHKTTGDQGNLWYEETLPTETLLYAFALCHKPREKSDTLKHPEDIVHCLEELTSDGYLQIGGNETVGQGWCSLKLNPESEG